MSVKPPEGPVATSPVGSVMAGGTILYGTSLSVMSLVVKPDVVADEYASPLGFSRVTPFPPAGLTINPGD